MATQTLYISLHVQFSGLKTFESAYAASKEPQKLDAQSEAQVEQKGKHKPVTHHNVSFAVRNRTHFPSSFLVILNKGSAACETLLHCKLTDTLSYDRFLI